jgi:kynureninase
MGNLRATEGQCASGAWMSASSSAVARLLGARNGADFRNRYAAFLADPDRVLLTGHSHQAWPDVCRQAMLDYFDDSARAVDRKWEKILQLEEQVGRKVLQRLELPDDSPISFGKSTHELIARWLGALGVWPGARDARVVTTSSEFHSLHRQLSRLQETGVQVDWIAAFPREDLCSRLISAIASRPTAVAISGVFFEDAYRLSELDKLVAAADAHAVPLLVDAYHAFNVAPLPWGEAVSTAPLYVVSGGYKYAQFGEGICFLRTPKSCSLRPVDTGWMADFGALAKRDTQSSRIESVGYEDGNARFRGATFDGTALYRAAATLEHFDSFGLGIAELRALSLEQTALILEGLDSAGLGASVRTPRSNRPGLAL